MNEVLGDRRRCGNCGEKMCRRQLLRHKNEGNCKPIDTPSADPQQDSSTDHGDAPTSEGDNYPSLGKQLFAEVFDIMDEEDRAFYECQAVDTTQMPSDDDEYSDIESDSDVESEIEDLPDTDESTIQESTMECDDSVAEENNGDVIVRSIFVVLLVVQSHYTLPDGAMEQILMLLLTIFTCLSKDSPMCCYIASKIPTCQKKVREALGIDHKYRKYVICIKCKSLYRLDQCTTTLEGKEVSKLCTHVEFPNSRKRKTIKCGQSLMKVVDTDDGPKLKPFHIYYYQPLKNALQKFMLRSGFEEKCEKWRQRTSKEGLFTDIYDGQVWKDFADPLMYNFLNHQRHLGLMMNVDWFQPFDHVNYSVGAVYLVLLSLPIAERFKQENVILVGLIPHLGKEPKTNTFLRPLVDELREAWYDGFKLYSYNSVTEKVFNLVLLCVGCDIPAARKVCGFLGHNANLGCNKCLKTFPGKVGEKTFGGFDRHNWTVRTNRDHRQRVRHVKEAKNVTERRKREKQYGVRYSVLLDLPYFDPVRMTIVDPMHNLFLGSAKRMMKIWRYMMEDAITKQDLEKMQDILDQFKCPSDIGNIPHKVASCFSGLTADQLKNWTIIYSMLALQGILNERDIKCWQKFVLACRLLCTKVLDIKAVNLADSLLLTFCTQLETLYGSEKVTPNMHLHCHIRESILDYGPIYGFWLFSFERYNGTIGKCHTNRRQVEGQFFRKFNQDVIVRGMDYSNLHPDFLSIIEQLRSKQQTRGSLLSQSKPITDLQLMLMSSTKCNVRDHEWNLPLDSASSVYGTRPEELRDDEKTYLKDMYKFIYGPVVNDSSMFVLCPAYSETNSVRFVGHVLGAKKGRSKRSSVVCANWCESDGRISEKADQRPGQIQKFLIHKVIIGGCEKVHVLAKVLWYQEPSARLKKVYPFLKPVEMWSPLYVDPGPALFVPVQRLRTKAVKVTQRVKERDVLFISPRQRYLTYE